jgi:DNA-binding XRE family transcriptional regulator
MEAEMRDVEKVARWLALLDEMEDEYFALEEEARRDDPELGPGYDEDHTTLEEMRDELLALMGSGFMNDEQGEEWRTILGYEDSYEVSSFGRVRSLLGVSPRILKPAWAGKGYATVGLLGKQHYVHHLVLRAFSGPRPKGQEASHLDGNRDNNRADNLAWMTRADNHALKKEHGTSQEGDRHGMSKLTEKQVLSIRSRCAEGNERLARDFGVDRRTIYDIQEGRTWTHLPLHPQPAAPEREARAEKVYLWRYGCAWIPNTGRNLEMEGCRQIVDAILAQETEEVDG